MMRIGISILQLWILLRKPNFLQVLFSVVSLENLMRWPKLAGKALLMVGGPAFPLDWKGGSLLFGFV